MEKLLFIKKNCCLFLAYTAVTKKYLQLILICGYMYRIVVESNFTKVFTFLLLCNFLLLFDSYPFFFHSFIHPSLKNQNFENQNCLRQNLT